ncbi:BRO family protein [Thomasclavelia cocleata]|uniref:Prophage antirepressor n=1 Tax=Thomasclavelia cocleata TaxID=69824 RepID=A0A1I0GEM6_9FIRM|nr:BRO family protein [Thomasclavelia cocleata]MCR1959849.1 BRO family protein [Thomasclavelia cocleata]SET68613.1 Prophage antirepressor [Thomasclavelia cocleata]
MELCELQIFKNKELGLDIGVKYNDDGSISVSLEDAARGLGFTQTQNKKGKQYTSIRWERIKNFLSEFGVPPLVGEDIFIPEPVFYLLAMKANNNIAKKFQIWVAKDVLPTIRKTGNYSIRTVKDSYMIENPIERAKRWIEEETERQNLRLENKELTKEVMYKEDVIGGLVDDIDLAEKRRRITQIIRQGSDKYSERYNLLYHEFEMKYKMDLNRRMDSDKYKNIKPKIKNKMDRGLHKIPQLYEIACKLFENDVVKLQQEIWNTCSKF